MNYYQILGISQSASNADIKRAYRKLAVVYHPDKNSDPRAEDVFKSINEAYEVLSDPDKRRDYDIKIQAHPAQAVQPAQRRHRDPAYKPGRPRVYKKSESQRLHGLMEEYLPYVQKISMLCLVISLVLLIDYCWPYQQTKEKIEHVAERTVYGKSSSTTWWVINTSSGLDIDIHYAYAKFFPPGTSVEITASRFLKIPISVSVPKHTEKMRVSIYGNFIFAPIALLVLSVLAVAFRRHVDYGFNLGIASFTFLLLLLFIIAVI